MGAFFRPFFLLLKDTFARKSFLRANSLMLFLFFPPPSPSLLALLSMTNYGGINIYRVVALRETHGRCSRDVFKIRLGSWDLHDTVEFVWMWSWRRVQQMVVPL